MTKSNITDSHSLLRRNLVLTVCRRTTRLNQHKRRGVYVISVTWFLSSQGIIKEIVGEEIGSICEQKNVKNSTFKICKFHLEAVDCKSMNGMVDRRDTGRHTTPPA